MCISGANSSRTFPFFSFKTSEYLPDVFLQFVIDVRVTPVCLFPLFPSVVADNPRSRATDISCSKQQTSIKREKYGDNQEEFDTTPTFQSVNVFQ